MSKWVLLGDVHFGIKNHDKQIAEYQLKFFKNVLIPYINEHNITTIIQTGDWFDSRRAIRHATLQLIRSEIIPLLKPNQNWYVIVGNHDMGMKETIHPNSATEILSVYPNFTIIDTARTVTIDDIDVDLIPWICQENKKSTYEFIKNSLSLYAVGHFELSGFLYYKGIESSGENSGFLGKYSQVWSGHFHTRSERGNIKYIGTPYQLTHGDADDARGFEVFDTITKTTEFIENPYTLYTKLYYDADVFDKSNLDSFKNKHIKIIVVKRGAAAEFDQLVSTLSEFAYSVDVIDNFDIVSTDSNLKIDITDTIKIISDYVEELNESAAIIKELKNIMHMLYSEATRERV